MLKLQFTIVDLDINTMHLYEGVDWGLLNSVFCITPQTGARGRLELAVGCEHLLCVEGLTVTFEMKNSKKSAIPLLWILSSTCGDFVS